jgi:hypothetical protein
MIIFIKYTNIIVFKTFHREVSFQEGGMIGGFFFISATSFATMYCNRARVAQIEAFEYKGPCNPQGTEPIRKARSSLQKLVVFH